MKIIEFYLLSITVLPIVVMAHMSLAPSLRSETNLTDWREHRRKKRFILYEGTSICKLVTGIAFPVDLHDKRTWRQLVVTYNIQYQFPVPPTPIYWWDKWGTRNLPGDVPAGGDIPDKPGEVQQFLFEVAENFMDRRDMDGRECLLKAICENAQIHEHQGLYAELLHRLLMPHPNTASHYLDAWHMGKHGVECQHSFPKAQNCLLDQHTHVRESFMQQSTVV